MNQGRPLVSLIAIALVTAVMVVGIFRVEIDATISTMLVSNDPGQQAHDNFKTVFGSDEVLSIGIPFNDVLVPTSLRLQRLIVEELELVKGVLQVTALVSQDDVVGDDDAINVLPLISAEIEDALRTADARAALRTRVSNHPIWSGWLVAADFGAIAIQVRLDDSPEAELQRQITLDEIDSVLVSALEGGDYFLAGHPFMKSEIARSIATDLARLLPIAFIVMTVLLLLATRSLLVGGITSFAVLLSVVWMVGAMGWCGLGMTALTNTAPTILVALSTACLLHFTAAYQSSSASGNSTAIGNALGKTLRPTWIAAVTTALGYGSLGLSSVPIVREFGYTLAIGVLCVAVLATVFLPAILAVVPHRRGSISFGDGFGLGRILLWVARMDSRYARSIFVASLALGLFMAVAALDLRVDSSGPGRFDEESRFRVSSDFYRSHLSGDVLESAYFEGEVDDFLDPQNLRRLQQFANAAERLPEVDKVVSVADFIARTYWVFRGETGDPSLLPETSVAVAQLLLLHESSGGSDEITDYISADRSMARVILTADVQSSAVSRQLRVDLSTIGKRFLPDHSPEYSVVSTEMLLSNAADVIAVEQIRSAALALLMVLVVISIGFKSLKIGFLVFLPNVLPIAMNLGIMSLLGISLSDATSIISATAIGIAVDSTVHILSSMRKAEVRCNSRRAAVVHALLATGRPVIASSFIVVLGFSILLLSDFGSVAELGALTALTMIYCLLADLLVLPAQLLLFTISREEPDPVVFSHGGGHIVASGLIGEDGAWKVGKLCERPRHAQDGINFYGGRRLSTNGQIFDVDLTVP